jgi:ELWxxDGT repeat protein
MGANAQTISFVHDLNNMGSNYQILASVDFKGKLYFTTHSMYESGSLWQTDGTNNGTSLVYTWPKPVLGGLEFSPNLLTIFNNKLYFVSTDSAHGRELWTSDGTTAGTYLLKDIMPGSGSAFAPEYAGFGNGFRNNFCQLNNKLYFIASDISHNEEIWETDGTAAGTKQSFDLNGNNTSSLEYAPLAVSNGKLFFTGADGVYVSNGSLAGTSRIISGYNCFNPIPFETNYALILRSIIVSL